MIYIDVIFNMVSGTVHIPKKLRALDSKVYAIRGTVVESNLEGKIITANITRPDEITIVDSAQVIDSNTFEYIIADNALLKPGKIELDFSVISPNSKLTTPKVELTLEKPIDQDGAIDGEDVAPIILKMVASEAERVSNENLRVTAETNRVTKEAIREQSEEVRVVNETNRVSTENQRDNNETTRKGNETVRKSNETKRKNAETARVTAEDARVVAENLRISAEGTRSDEFTTMKNEHEVAMGDASDLKADVKELKDQVNKPDLLQIQMGKGESTIKSVNDSYSGAVENVEIEGALKWQCINNGDYSNGLDNVRFIAVTTPIIDGGVLKFTANGRGGFAGNVDVNINNFGKTMLYIARVKSDSSVVHLQGYDGVVNAKDYHSGSNEFEMLTIKIAHQSDETDIRVRDPRSSDWTEIEVDFWMAIELDDDEKLLSSNDLKIRYANYFEGLQPLRGVSVESVGKNLFDKNLLKSGTISSTTGVEFDSNIRVKDSRFNVLDNSKSYHYKDNDNSIKLVAVNEYDANKSFFKSTVMQSTDATLTFNSSTFYYKNIYGFINDSVIKVEDVLDKRIQIEEGITPTTYEPYQSSKVVYPDPLAELPNGEKDTIDTRTGIKTARTNVGRDGDFYYLKDEDLSNFTTSFTNYDLVILLRNRLGGIYNQNSGLTQDKIYIDKFVKNDEYTGGDYADTSSYVNTFIDSMGSSSNIVLFLKKNKYSSLENVKTALAGTKIAYELSTPQQIQLQQVEPINSYERYTQFSVSDGVVEGEKAKLEISFNYYRINDIGVKTELKNKVRKFNDVLFKGYSIFNLGSIFVDNAYGNERWLILDSVVESNNIDINQIYVDYTTLESNGQTNAKVTYNADLSSAVSSNANAISKVGQATDDNSREIERITEPLEWFEPTPLNDWVNLDDVNSKFEIAKDSLGFVHVRGHVKNGTSGHIATLPNGFRPSATETFPASSANAFASVYITKDGVLSASAGYSDSWIALKLCYYAEG